MKMCSMFQTKTPIRFFSDPKISAVLDRLHRSSRGDLMRFPAMGVSEVLDRVLRRKPTVAERADRMKDIFVSLSRKQGKFAYLVARSVNAKRIVEFGTSFGISTIYFAAAIRDNGGGIVIGSEIEEAKVAKAQEHLEEAGLSEYVEIRVGDAQQTLADPGGEVDLVLMDGWKDLYLPVIKMLAPHICTGGVVLSDNIFTFKRTLAPFVAYMENPANGFQSVTLPLGDGMQYSVRIST
jgi:predicted O-methyltransferase YrrM